MSFRCYLILAVIFLATGCASAGPGLEGASLRTASFAADTAATSPAQQKRQVIKSSSITISVSSIEQVSGFVEEITGRYKGLIDSSNQYNDKSVNIRVRVPSASLEAYVDDLTTLGTVIANSTSSRDVTEQIVDYDAKLKNLLVLRDRYRQLLEKATKVSEILEIERELNKVQTQIDSIQGWRTSLMDQVAMSSVNIKLEQDTIYGPLGYLGKGILWAIGKLFVIK